MTIPANRNRFPILLILGLISSAILIIVLINAIKHFNEDGYNSAIFVGAYSGLLYWAIRLMCISFIEYYKTTFDKNAVLTISENGIDDNLSIFSVGKVGWPEITNVTITNLYKTDFLIIKVADPESLIERRTGYKQRILKGYIKRFGSPIVISQKRVNFKLADLKDILSSKNLK
jgi:hypothetical protein